MVTATDKVVFAREKEDPKVAVGMNTEAEKAPPGVMDNCMFIGLGKTEARALTAGLAEAVLKPALTVTNKPWVSNAGEPEAAVKPLRRFALTPARDEEAKATCTLPAGAKTSKLAPPVHC